MMSGYGPSSAGHSPVQGIPSHLEVGGRSAPYSNFSSHALNGTAFCEAGRPDSPSEYAPRPAHSHAPSRLAHHNVPHLQAEEPSQAHQQTGASQADRGVRPYDHYAELRSPGLAPSSLPAELNVSESPDTDVPSPHWSAEEHARYELETSVRASGELLGNLSLGGHAHPASTPPQQGMPHTAMVRVYDAERAHASSSGAAPALRPSAPPYGSQQQPALPTHLHLNDASWPGLPGTHGGHRYAQEARHSAHHSKHNSGMGGAFERTHSEVVRDQVNTAANQQVEYILAGPFRDEELRGKLIDVRFRSADCLIQPLPLDLSLLWHT